MGKNIKKVVFLMLFFVMSFAFAALASEEAEAKYTVKYGEIKNSKFVNTYSNWNVVAEKGKEIRTPKVADRNGKRCYWKVAGNGGKTAEVENGESFVLYGNANVAIEWKQLFTIRFFKYNGTKEHKDKTITLAKGEKFYLPSITPHVTKLFKGWSRVKNATSPNYNCTTHYTMVGNLNLYEVIVPKPKGTPTVELMTFYGNHYKTITPDGKATFPSMQCSGYMTFQGWSRTKGKTSDPDYFEGQKIPTTSATYYMVVATAPKDPNGSSKETVRESSKYRMTYFVGDSRMEQANNHFGKSMKKTKFIAKGGMGYAWFTQKGGAYEQLISALKSNPNKTNKKDAIIFCFGVNDLQNYQKYIDFYKSKASYLKSFNCDLYVMSVNPFCVGQRYYWNKAHGNPNHVEKRTQAARIVFNREQMNQLKGIYSYVDIFTYLKETGWPTADLSKTPTPDGLHYTLDTTKRVVSRATTIMDQRY